MAELKAGDPAPDFSTTDQDGNAISLKALRGKNVILYFYPKDDTPGCTKESCGFRDNFPVLEATNATVIGLSPDEPKALAKWKAKEGLPYTLVSDPDHATAEAYGVWGEKKMYGKPFMGIIRSHVIIGPDGTIEDVQYGVSPKDSVDKARAFLTN